MSGDEQGYKYAADIIDSSFRKTHAKAFKENQWGKRHVEAWQLPHGPERGMRDLIKAAAEYADEYRDRYESPIGGDGFLGPAWLQILKSIRTLLNGELGRLDGGTLDQLLLDMAESQGMNLED